MTEFSGAGTAARANRALDPLHAMIYFAPEADEEFERVGLRPAAWPTSPAGRRRWAR